MWFKMNNLNWQIVKVNPDSSMLTRSDGSQTIGMCDGNTNTIYIADTLSGELLYKVLRHEICHSAMFSYGYDFDIPQEECICDIMATYGNEVIDIANNIYNYI